MRGQNYVRARERERERETEREREKLKPKTKCFNVANEDEERIKK